MAFLKQAPADQTGLLVVLGPTGSGKTALSLRLAEAFNGEIVSCDSVAVYRDFEIGTAKPALSERQSIPHHLIDIIAPTQGYSAGDYSRDARAAIAEIAGRGRLPIITGGTGLYLRALLQGLSPGPPRVDALRERLRAAEEKHGQGYLHRLLMRRDPGAAAAIHPNDIAKLIRAIEVSVTAGQPRTVAWSAGRDPLKGFRVLRIGLAPERQALYARIDHRAAQMFDDGLVEETRSLIAKYGPDLRLFEALGYRQASGYLRGEYPLVDAVRFAQQGHRNYAKRQITWFRTEPEVHWLTGFGVDPEIEKAAKTLVALS